MRMGRSYGERIGIKARKKKKKKKKTEPRTWINVRCSLPNMGPRRRRRRRINVFLFFDS